MSNYENVDVITGARLHFGLLCGAAELGWQYGGVGLMVDRPGWHIRLLGRPETAQQSTDADSIQDRVREILERLQPFLVTPLTPSDLRILQTCPHHAGFGAGTQLALAIASAMEVQQHRQARSRVADLSRVLGRAARSAVGTEGFAQGGFLVDHGLPIAPETVRRVERFSVPDDWRFLLVRPRNSVGLSGDSEKAYFDRRRVMPQDLVDSLVQLIMQQLVPAVQQSDFRKFAESLGQYGQRIGRFYAPEQGDVFSDPQMNGLADWLSRQGVHGAAQSSWGPGICIPVASMTDAVPLAERINRHLDDASIEIVIAAPRNYGATILTPCPEPGRGTRS